MAKLLIDQETIQADLKAAAEMLQAYYIHEAGTVYQLADLEQALTTWLELSVEALAQDAIFHAIQGDRTYAFNRPAFEQQIQRLDPVDEQGIEEQGETVTEPAKPKKKRKGKATAA